MCVKFSLKLLRHKVATLYKIRQKFGANAAYVVPDITGRHMH